MIFCDTGCSGVLWNPRNGRVSSSLRRLTEQLESEGIMGRGAGGRRDCFAGRRLAMTGGDLLGIPWPRNRELLRIRRVILRWLGGCAQTGQSGRQLGGCAQGHGGDDVMMVVVSWLAADGYWRVRCVRHVPASVRAWLETEEMPGFVEVREVDEGRFSCPACWAERMTGR